MKALLGAAAVVLALGAASTSAAPRIPTVGCDQAAQIPDQPPPPQDSLVLGRVSLLRPGEVLRLGRRVSPGGPWWTKRGVSVVAGTPVVLEVPPRFRRVYGFTWGSNGARALGASVVRLRTCPTSSALWTSWAGGFFTRRAACVPLVVRANGRAARVGIALGRRCPAVISSKTVSAHIQHILVKLDVNSRTQAVAYAYRRGLVDGRVAESR